MLRKFKIHAAPRNQSISNLMAQAIRDLMERDRQNAAAKRRFLARIRNAPDRGTGGTIGWTRDELHEDFSDGQRLGPITVRNPFR